MPYTPDREGLSWAAGFFDGEGCFTVGFESKPNRDGTVYRYPKVTISQSGTPELLYKFRQTIGFGKIHGPSTGKHKTAKKPRWAYVAGGFENMQAILSLLWLWLGTEKRNKARYELSAYLTHLHRLRG